MPNKLEELIIRHYKDLMNLISKSGLFYIPTDLRRDEVHDLILMIYDRFDKDDPKNFMAWVWSLVLFKKKGDQSTHSRRAERIARNKILFYNLSEDASCRNLVEEIFATSDSSVYLSGIKDEYLEDYIRCISGDDTELVAKDRGITYQNLKTRNNRVRRKIKDNLKRF